MIPRVEATLGFVSKPLRGKDCDDNHGYDHSNIELLQNDRSMDRAITCPVDLDRDSCVRSAQHANFGSHGLAIDGDVLLK